MQIVSNLQKPIVWENYRQFVVCWMSQECVKG